MPSEILGAILGAVCTVALGWINRHRLYRFMVRNFYPLNHPNTNSFCVLVADLDGDVDCKHTYHIVEALGKMGGFEVRTASEVLRCAPIATNLADTKARIWNQAQRWLREHKADVLVWGRYHEKTYQLGFVPRNSHAKSGEWLSGYKIESDFTLPEDFTDGIRTLIAITIFNTILPASEESGKFLANKMLPLTIKLKTYLAESKFSTPKETHLAWHSLGLAVKL